MSDESTLGREPIELVEIVLPRCANVYGVAPCTASQGVGGECFNCRATCQDPDNYRAEPLANLVATYTGGQLDTGNTAAALPDDVSIEVDFEFALSPDGLLFEIGGSTNGVYIGFTSGNLIIRGGDGSGAPSATTANLSVDPAPYIGKRYRLIARFERVAATSLTLTAFLFDPIERDLISLGSDVASDAAAYDTDGWGIGAANSTVAGGGTQTETDYNGVIYSASVYEAASSLTASDVFSNNLWLGRGVKGEPADEKYILPCLQDLGTSGTKINLSGADDDYKPLGRRATLDFALQDFAHSDVTQDPYLATRPYDPSQKSTFWRKWLQRQKFAKVGARVRVYDGYAGNPLSTYLKRGYVMEEARWTENGVSFYCRDELARTEFLKAQVPAPSRGSLSAALTNVATSLTMAGEFARDEYPASGTIRINDEIITYTTKAYDSGTDTTTLSGLTRGTDGSTADSHDASDQVQLCKRYAAATVEDVVKDLLQIEAGIDGQLIDLAELASEQTSYFVPFSLSALLTVPEGVDSIIGRLSQEVGAYIWWDERAQKIRMKAIRAVGVNEVIRTLSYEENILRDSMSLAEKPRQRINVITVYYNPIDKAGDLESPTNFSNALKLINGNTSLPEQYGNVIQSRDIFAQFLTSEAVVNQTAGRLAARYEDVPVFAEFLVDAKDRSLWTGDIIKIDHPAIVGPSGDRDIRRWLIVEAEEVEAGHLVRYVCADITLDGLIYTITENGIGDYTPELFAEGNIFITDNNGLNPDGTPGWRIS